MMSREEIIIDNIFNELLNNRNFEMDANIGNIKYRVKFLAPTDSIHLPSILAIPLTDEINNEFVMESNNFETEDLRKIILQGSDTAIRLAKLTSEKPSPIIIPLIPSYREDPYYQQLSSECFDLPETDRNYRIDEQVVQLIENAKNILSSEFGIQMNDKIFLNGYSASGVFAQRFALLHPEIVGYACIGGASGSIPLPTDELDYPLGIRNYEQITGKKFDLQSYSNIKFRYYVGELETVNKASDRTDDEGNLAPMHDMSYFDRSVPKDVGKKQRELLGKDMFQRARNTIDKLKSIGIDIEHYIIKGRSHNNRSGIGVNEIGDQIINECYLGDIPDNKIL